MGEAANRNALENVESALARELRAMVRDVAAGAEFEVDSSAELCSSLELFLPAVLESKYPKWRSESIDGFFIARSRKTGTAGAELIGTCILITDQTVTPFRLVLEASHVRDCIEAYRLWIGEPGDGPLGISGPECTSSRADRLLYQLVDRLDDVQWVFCVCSD